MFEAFDRYPLEAETSVKIFPSYTPGSLVITQMLLRACCHVILAAKKSTTIIHELHQEYARVDPCGGVGNCMNRADASC